MDTLVPVIGLSRSTFLADSAGGVCQYVEEGGRKGIQPVRGNAKLGSCPPRWGKEWTASYLLVEWHTCAPEDDSVHEVLAIQSCCSRQRAVGTTSVTNGTWSAARQLNRSHNSGATLHRRPGDDARGARVRTLHHLLASTMVSMLSRSPKSLTSTRATLWMDATCDSKPRPLSPSLPHHAWQVTALDAQGNKVDLGPSMFLQFTARRG